MIIVRLSGGLGNQLFQYAAARRLAIVHGTEVKYDPELTEANARPDRPLWLGKFRAPLGVVTPEEKERLRDRCIREVRFGFYPDVLDAEDDTILDGFWQSERYFADVAPIIRRDLAFRDPAPMERARKAIAGLKAMRGGDVVAVHVRRGDYTWPDLRPIFHELSVGWYKRAMKRFPKGTSFIIFSDDIQWCRANLAGEGISFGRPGRPLMDFALMRCCDHYIIANSTFSWWAAYLSENPDPQVFTPSADAWFGSDGRSWDTSQLLPERWVALLE